MLIMYAIPGLIYNACQLELEGVFYAIENVNKHQHFAAFFTSLASKCILTQVRLPCECNQLAYIVRTTIQSQ